MRFKFIFTWGSIVFDTSHNVVFDQVSGHTVGLNEKKNKKKNGSCCTYAAILLLKKFYFTCYTTKFDIFLFKGSPKYSNFLAAGKYVSNSRILMVLYFFFFVISINIYKQCLVCCQAADK